MNAARISITGLLALAILLRPESGEATPDRLRVMAFNVLEAGAHAPQVGFPKSAFGGDRRRTIAEIIHAHDADVVGLTECGAPAPWLERLGTNWHVAASGRSAYTAGIATRLRMETLRVEDWLVAVRVTTPGGQTCVVVNTHWSPPRNSGAGLIQQRLRDGTIPKDLAPFEQEILAKSDASAGLRGYRHTLDVLRPFLVAKANVIVTGDFNESSHLDWTARAATSGIDRWVKNPTGRPLRFKIAWTGSRLLAEAGLRDAYRTMFPDEVAKPGITWTPPYPSGTPGRRAYDDQVLERIDLIYFAGPVLSLRDAGVVGESREVAEFVHAGPWPSDHRAVLAEFEIMEVRP